MGVSACKDSSEKRSPLTEAAESLRAELDTVAERGWAVTPVDDDAIDVVVTAAVPTDDGLPEVAVACFVAADGGADPVAVGERLVDYIRGATALVRAG